MNITLISTKYNERHEIVIFKLKTNYGNLDFALTEQFEIDWNWENYDKLTRSEKEQIETFIKQYVFDKFREGI